MLAHERTVLLGERARHHRNLLAALDVLEGGRLVAVATFFPMGEGLFVRGGVGATMVAGRFVYVNPEAPRVFGLEGVGVATR